MFAWELYLQKYKFTKCVIPVYSHSPFVIETTSIGMLICYRKYKIYSYKKIVVVK